MHLHGVSVLHQHPLPACSVRQCARLRSPHSKVTIHHVGGLTQHSFFPSPSPHPYQKYIKQTYSNADFLPGIRKSKHHDQRRHQGLHHLVREANVSLRAVSFRGAVSMCKNFALATTDGDALVSHASDGGLKCDACVQRLRMHVALQTPPGKQWGGVHVQSLDMKAGFKSGPLQ